MVPALPIIGRPATPLPPAQPVPHRRRGRELFGTTIPCRLAAFTLKGNDRGRTRTDPTDARRDPDFCLRLRTDRLRRLPGPAVADRAEPGVVQPDRPSATAATVSPISCCRSCRRSRPPARWTSSVLAAHIRPRARRVAAIAIALCWRQTKGRSAHAWAFARSHRGRHRRGLGDGHAIALGFAREGATLAVLDINGETAAKTAADIHADGGRAQAFTLDITDQLACRDVAAKVAREIGQLVLVNMPASTGVTPLLESRTP